MWQSVEILNVFNTLTLKQIFWKTKSFFKKLEYCFLVESTKIENALFPYKTGIAEANIKTNKMVSRKWTYHKERSFSSNYFFFFWRFCYSLRTSSNDFTQYTNDPNSHIRAFCKCWSFVSRCFFLMSILKLVYAGAKVCSISQSGIQKEKEEG